MIFNQRAPQGEAEGMLILHHGRGTDELDLLPLADALDPARRLHVITPRAPLRLAGSPGYHWYVVRQVGHPDPETFAASFRELTAFHDELWTSTGIGPERTVLGGFSMGAVMSYATGLAGERPSPAGILAFSGFLPTVEGWDPPLDDRAGLPVLIAHGQADPVIGVEFARRARGRLEEAGLQVDYHESGVDHTIDPAGLRSAATWLAKVIP